MKRKRKRRAPEPCVYCGQPATTRDHVPAVAIFPEPRPSNLITVPSCETCRRATTMDDEYFRFILVMRFDIGNAPAARASWPALYRALRRPEAEGFRRLILENTREVDAYTPGGIYVGRTASFTVDEMRLERVLGRTVWGLFFHHFKRRPPDDMVAAIYCTLRLRKIGKLEEVSRVVAAPLRDAEEHVIARGVFSYRFTAAPDDPVVTAWLLTFYGTAEFVVLTVPRARAPRPMVHGLAKR